jgi:hypothetical protein
MAKMPNERAVGLGHVLSMVLALRFHRDANAIENRLTCSLLDAEELIELMDFRPDLLLGL